MMQCDHLSRDTHPASLGREARARIERVVQALRQTAGAQP